MIDVQLKKEVLKLNDLDKIHLIEELQNTLNKPSPDVEEKWIKESEARYRAYKEGKITTIPIEKVLGKYSS